MELRSIGDTEDESSLAPPANRLIAGRSGKIGKPGITGISGAATRGLMPSKLEEEKS